MKRILIVFTGGTIGCGIHNSTIDVDEKAGYNLIRLFRQKNDYEVEFDTVQPFNILSENSTPKHWELLYNALKETEWSRYEGVIITHGSDTVTYTSAAFSFLFRDTRIPIVITASNYALDCEKSNGLDNFTSSVELILNSAMPGIFTVYQNDKGENLVYLASRIMEADPYLDQYQSFGGAEFGEIKEGRFLPKENRINPKLTQLKELRQRLIPEDISFRNQILALRVYPGLDYDFINTGKKPKAILHSLYHSGTGCTEDFSYSLPGFIKKCRDEGIDFYLISFKSIDEDLYRTSREILTNGAIPLKNISFEAAYAKLCIAYNQNVMPPQEFVENELFFEYLPR